MMAFVVVRVFTNYILDTFVGRSGYILCISSHQSLFEFPSLFPCTKGKSQSRVLDTRDKHKRASSSVYQRSHIQYIIVDRWSSSSPQILSARKPTLQIHSELPLYLHPQYALHQCTAECMHSISSLDQSMQLYLVYLRHHVLGLSHP